MSEAFLNDEAHQLSQVKQLRKIRKKIRKIVQKCERKIQRVKNLKMQKVFQVNEKSQSYIDGTDGDQFMIFKRQQDYVIQVDDTDNTMSSEVKAIRIKNSGIDGYWKTVLLNSYGQQLQPSDYQILPFIKGISVKQFTGGKVTIQFSICQGSDLIQRGDYQKTIVRQLDGTPIEYEGNMIRNENKIGPGLFNIIFCTDPNDEELRFINDFFELLSIQIIPRSIHYYLQQKWDQQTKQVKVTRQNKEN